MTFSDFGIPQAGKHRGLFHTGDGASGSLKMFASLVGCRYFSECFSNGFSLRNGELETICF